MQSTLQRLAWFALTLALPLVASAANTEPSLLLAAESARPGDPVLAGLRFKMAKSWHIYWRNPGDSGEAPKVTWQLPVGFTVDALQWPPPKKLVIEGITTYGYEDEVVLLAQLRVAADAPAGTVELSAKLRWLECADVCVQGKGEVRAKLEISAGRKPSANAALIEKWQKRLPADGAKLAASARWETGPAEDERNLKIDFLPPSPGASWDFFPYEPGDLLISNVVETLPGQAGRAGFRKQIRKLDGEWPERFSGLLANLAAPAEAYEVSLAVAAPGVAPASAAVSVPPRDRSLLAMLFLAFLGGLILNIMPCVLPVIALKVLSFVNQSGASRGRVRQLGLIYGVGVLVSFLALAVIAVATAKAGGIATWGMTLQHQPVRVLLTVLVTLVALNLFGVFEVSAGSRVLSTAGDLSAKEGPAGAFFNGLLATLLATPCTAPFLGGALAFAFTQSAATTVLVFLAAGAGLAAPFVALCWQPAWLRWLPKPGAWMQHFKVAMGFPMLATAMWLFWFTAPRFGRSGVLWFGLFLVVLALAAWIYGEFFQRGTRQRGLALTFTVLLLVAGYAGLLEDRLHWRTNVARENYPNSLKESPEGIDWKPWSPEALALARAAGRPVLVDFTADNCLNCQVNKRTSLEISSTRARLKEINAVALLGDFTDEDPRIAKVLVEYQRAGVPLVLVYPRDAAKPPIVLPTILTPDLVLKALTEAAK